MHYSIVCMIFNETVSFQGSSTPKVERRDGVRGIGQVLPRYLSSDWLIETLIILVLHMS